MKTTKIIYWASTGLISLGMAFSAYADLVQAPDLAAGMKHLGYPSYVMTILGVAKILGVIALLVPGFKTLKEWAYAGFTFELIGAIWSHTAVDGFQNCHCSFSHVTTINHLLPLLPQKE